MSLIWILQRIQPQLRCEGEGGGADNAERGGGLVAKMGGGADVAERGGGVVAKRGWCLEADDVDVVGGGGVALPLMPALGRLMQAVS